MDRTLGENGSLTCSHGVGDEASSVLFDEPDIHVTVNEEKELSRSGVCVGGVHSAGSNWMICFALASGLRRVMGMYDLRHLADSHSYAVCKERREVGDVGEGEVSATTPDGPDSSIVIKQKLIQIRRSTREIKVWIMVGHSRLCYS